jgi:hypothetical protein
LQTSGLARSVPANWQFANIAHPICIWLAFTRTALSAVTNVFSA